jgi:hypothetical protein
MQIVGRLIEFCDHSNGVFLTAGAFLAAIGKLTAPIAARLFLPYEI